MGYHIQLFLLLMSSITGFQINNHHRAFSRHMKSSSPSIRTFSTPDSPPPNPSTPPSSSGSKIKIKKREKKGTTMIFEEKPLSDVEFYKLEEEKKALAANGGVPLPPKEIENADELLITISESFRANAGAIIDLTGE